MRIMHYSGVKTLHSETPSQIASEIQNKNSFFYKFKNMKIIKISTIILLFSYLVFFNLSCTKKRTDVVSLSINPQSPVVINADFTTVDALGNQFTISAPWFQFNISVTNNTPDTVTIITLKGKITSTTADTVSGGYESKDFAFDTTGILNRSYLVEVPGVDSATGLATTKKVDVSFYVFGLPKGDGKTLSYSASFELVGWSGAHNDAIGRFVTYPVYISTK